MDFPKNGMRSTLKTMKNILKIYGKNVVKGSKCSSDPPQYVT
jgi:hypothetical protein